MQYFFILGLLFYGLKANAGEEPWEIFNEENTDLTQYIFQTKNPQINLLNSQTSQAEPFIEKFKSRPIQKKKRYKSKKVTNLNIKTNKNKTPSMGNEIEHSYPKQAKPNPLSYNIESAPPELFYPPLIYLFLGQPHPNFCENNKCSEQAIEQQ